MGFQIFFNCEALGLDIPVCVKNDDGTTSEFENACAAFDSGFKFKDLTFCDGLPIGGGNGGNPINNINCEALGIDLPINVCVKDDNGEKFRNSLVVMHSQRAIPPKNWSSAKV